MEGVYGLEFWGEKVGGKKERDLGDPFGERSP